MRLVYRIAPVVVALALALVFLFGLALAAPAAPAALPTQKGGFLPMGDAATRVAEIETGRPSLAVPNRRIISPSLQIIDRRIISPSAALAVITRRIISPAVAFAAPTKRIISPTVQVMQFNSSTQAWEPQGSLLYTDEGDATMAPSIDFGGASGREEWVAFAEVRSAMNNVKQIFVGEWNGMAWQVMSQPLNSDPTHNADHPALAAGAVPPIGTLLPWVAWEEDTPGGTRSIIARRFIPTAGPAPLEQWPRVGQPLNASGGQAGLPDLAFSGANNTVPWVVWQETSGAGVSHVYAARAVPDAESPGGYRWEVVGRQAGCAWPNDCALLINPADAALMPRVASGSLPGETVPTPWVTFVEQNGGRSEIHVMRLSLGNLQDPSDDHFVAVGGSVNASCLARRKLSGTNGSDPDIAVVGSVPHVTWTEERANGSQVYVCHLFDARPGQEIWDMDTGRDGVDAAAGSDAKAPVIASDGETPVVAWSEQSAATGKTAETAFHVSLRSPLGPAWGSTIPASDLSFLDESATLTTSCDHVNGWRQVQRIELALYDRQTESRVFYGKYVPGATPITGRISVEDPAHPDMCNPGQSGSICLGDVVIGTNSDIDVGDIVLNVGAMTAVSHGPVSPALDINWVFHFKRPAQYVHAINIVYNDTAAKSAVTTETDLFQTGSILVARLVGRLFLPVLESAYP